MLCKRRNLIARATYVTLEWHYLAVPPRDFFRDDHAVARRPPENYITHTHTHIATVSQPPCFETPSIHGCLCKLR